jgi:hypothetical protein
LYQATEVQRQLLGCSSLLEQGLIGSSPTRYRQYNRVVSTWYTTCRFHVIPHSQQPIQTLFSVIVPNNYRSN